MNRRFLDTPYGQVHYIDAGPKDAEAIMLLHKCPRSSDEYADIAPILAKRYRAIAMDTIGYGDSDKPEKQPSVDDYARIVWMLMDSLKIKKATIVGHLSGSILGIELAASSPERIKKLVLSGPIYLDAEARAKRKDKWPQWKVKKDGSHLMEIWNERMAIAKDLKLVNRIFVDVMKAGETSEYQHYANAVYHMEERLPLVKCPVLLVIGKKDPYVYPQKCHMFKQILPDAKEVFLEEGSYFLPEENPETFAKLVMDFVG